jgi:hypothetical protein
MWPRECFWKGLSTVVTMHTAGHRHRQGGEAGIYLPPLDFGGKIELNRKLWEELLVHFPWYDTDLIENNASKNSIVAWVFVAAVTFLPSRCLATISDTRTWISLYETWCVYHGTWTHSSAYFINASHQSVCLYVFLGNGMVKNVSAATTIDAVIEELLRICFYVGLAVAKGSVRVCLCIPLSLGNGSHVPTAAKNYWSRLLCRPCIKRM